MLTGIIPTLLGTLAQEKNGDQEVTPCRPNLLTMLLLEKENSAPKKNLLRMSLNQLFSKESFIFNMWMVNASGYYFACNRCLFNGNEQTF